MKKIVYPYELKLEVVQKYLQGSIGMMRLAKEYGISSVGDVRFWVERYKANGPEGLKNIHHEKYTSEFKKSVIEYMYSSGSSQHVTAAHFNIPSRETIRRWKREYDLNGDNGLVNKPKGRKKMHADRKKVETMSKEELIRENQKLQMEIDYLKKLQALIQERKQVPETKRSR